MLPFLKNRMEGAASSPVEVVTREPDDKDAYDMLDAIADDLLHAIDKKDSKLIKEALLSLCDHIQMQDEQQDNMEATPE